MSLAAFLVVLLDTGAASSPTFAARPAECGVQDGARTANPWERAKEPQLRRYCDLLARAAARLVHSEALVADVVGVAEEAEKLLPGRAAPSVLKGRAYLRLGKPTEALAALSEARSRDERALDDPIALLAWARANARTGHTEEATAAFRAALPRASTLSAQERTAASFEAGLIVMAQGQKGVDDAIAMLRQARRDAQEAMHGASVVALALALDRAGQREEATAVLAERIRGDVRPLLADPSVVQSLRDAGVAHEANALAAIALEAYDAAAARDAWKKYLEGPGGKGAWADHARARDNTKSSSAGQPPRGGAKR